MRLPVAISCEWCSRASSFGTAASGRRTPRAGSRAVPAGAHPCNPPTRETRARRQSSRPANPAPRCDAPPRRHALAMSPTCHPGTRLPCLQPAAPARGCHVANPPSGHPAARDTRPTEQPAPTPFRVPRQRGHRANRVPRQPSSPPLANSTPPTRAPRPNLSAPPQPELPPGKEPLTPPPGTHSLRGARFRCTACPPGMRTWAPLPGHRAGRCSRSSGSPGSGRSRSGTLRN